MTGLPRSRAAGFLSRAPGQFNRYHQRPELRSQRRAALPPKGPALPSDLRRPDGRRAPVHLHRNSFLLTDVWANPLRGVIRDVMLAKGYGKIALYVTPGMAPLFFSHQRSHKDYGFKLLFKVV